VDISDPLPWQCFSRYPSICEGVRFIDIDYRDLIIKKRMVVQNTSELNSMLTNIEVSEGDCLFRSDQYLQLGCDLRDLTNLERVLQDKVDIKNCELILE
jgi:tRNA wybutosine-synthesizing protein 4